MRKGRLASPGQSFATMARLEFVVLLLGSHADLHGACSLALLYWNFINHVARLETVDHNNPSRPCPKWLPAAIMPRLMQPRRSRGGLGSPPHSGSLSPHTPASPLQHFCKLSTGSSSWRCPASSIAAGLVNSLRLESRDPIKTSLANLSPWFCRKPSSTAISTPCSSTPLVTRLPG